jgi:hypothetical protein
MYDNKNSSPAAQHRKAGDLCRIGEKEPEKVIEQPEQVPAEPEVIEPGLLQLLDPQLD